MSSTIEAFAIMDRHLTEAAVALFDSLGIPVRCAAPKVMATRDSAERSVVAIIGFAGENVRGSLVLLALGPAIQSWLAPLGLSDVGADAADALREMSNMLLGRLKGSLLSEGFPIMLSTPTTAFGGDLKFSNPVRPSAWLCIEGAGWHLDVRLDATFDDGFVLQARDRQVCAEAGDALFF